MSFKILDCSITSLENMVSERQRLQIKARKKGFIDFLMIKESAWT